MAVKLITPPVGYPVTLAEAKLHLRVDHTDEDSIIETYLAAATHAAEVFCGRAIVTQTLELVLDAFRAQIEIPRPPLQSVVSVKYDDSAGDEQSLIEHIDYEVDNVSQPGWVVAVNSEWPATIDTINAVRIRYVAGYVDNNSPPLPLVPGDIKAAVLLTLGKFYAQREDIVIGTIVTAIPWAAEQLLRQHRVELAMA